MIEKIISVSSCYRSHSKIIFQVGVINISVKCLTNTAILACWLVQFWHLLRQVSILMNLISWENSWAARCKVEIGTVFRSRIWYTLFRDKVFEKIAQKCRKISSGASCANSHFHHKYCTFRTFGTAGSFLYRWIFSLALVSPGRFPKVNRWICSSAGCIYLYIRNGEVWII